MKFAKILAVGAMLAAGVAYADEERTDPNAKMREEVMEEIGKAMGVLGGMAKGETAFDAAAAEAAKAKIAEEAAQIATDFATQGEPDPASEAKPEIWTSWDDFLKKADALKVAAEGADVSTAEALGAAMGAMGGACKDCHTTYRVMK